jgi:hypothetical protein
VIGSAGNHLPTFFRGNFYSRCLYPGSFFGLFCDLWRGGFSGLGLGLGLDLGRGLGLGLGRLLPNYLIPGDFFIGNFFSSGLFIAV